MGRSYQDFVVSVTTDGDGYLVTASFGDRSAEHRFTVPFGDDELQSFYDMFGRARRRRMESPQMERTRVFGDRLYRTVFADELDRMLTASMLEAEAGGHGLRIRLRLEDAPVLVNLPWEYIYRRAADDFPALSNWTPLVRSLAVEEGLPPARVNPPLKILVMISNPVEYQDTLDTDAEWDRLHQSLAPQLASGLVEVEALPQATEAALQTTLRRKDFHVFHFVGHGEFSQSEHDGVLLLEDERRRTKLVTGGALGTILRDSRPLRLVVLNNCEGARTSDLDPFAGAAQSLLRKGIPAVVAMQFEVTDEAAIAFSQGFYGGLGDGFPVDGALSEARKSMNRASGAFEFGSPVLYLAAPTGEIFDVTGRDAEMPPDVSPAERTAEITPDPVGAPEPVEDDHQPPETGNRSAPGTPQSEHPTAVPDVDRKPVRQPGRPEHGQGSIPDRGGKPAPADKPRRRFVRTVAVLAAAVLAATVLGDLLRDGSRETADRGVDLEVPPTIDGDGPGGEADIDAVYLEEPPTIDGDNGDWPAGTGYPTPHRAAGEDDPRVSSEWSLGWDEEALYLFVRVTDPEVTAVNADRPWVLYRGDGVNLILGGDPGSLSGQDHLQDDDIQVMLGPATSTVDGVVVGAQVPTESPSDSNSACPGGRVFGSGTELPDVEAAATPTADGYDIEARLPWSVLRRDPTPGDFLLPGGRRGGNTIHGLILSVADAAENGGRRGSRSSHPDRESVKHCPGRWQTLELVS